MHTTIEEQKGKFFKQIETSLEYTLQRDLKDWRKDLEVLHEAAYHICFTSKAKRARPRLIYLFGQALGAPLQGLIDTAIAAELIHTASLLHDDVVDEGTLRRDISTVNVRWGNLIAVLTGDLLLSAALRQLVFYKRELTSHALEVVQEMTRSAMMEVRMRGNVDLDEDTWKSIANGKTGVLFAWCGKAPAELVNDQDASHRFSLCGHHLGMAFQMADDLKDLKDHSSGKNRFADISNRNPSFSLLTAMKRSPALYKEFSTAWKKEKLSSQEVENLGKAVLDTGAAEITLHRIRDELDKAMESLGHYYSRPGCSDVFQWASVLWKGL